MINSKEEAIEYLRSLDYICMPSKYTYFHHNACYKAEHDRKIKGFDKSWNNIPTEDFFVNLNMSCVERDKRIQTALQFGGLEHASISYAPEKGSKLFAIRIIMPKNNLSIEEYEALGLSETDVNKLKSEYAGFGDLRHPKLGDKEHIIMIGNITKDEVSGKDIDIVYGVREQDIIGYANLVSKQVEIESKLPNDKFNRFTSQGLTSSNPETALEVMSPYEDEYNQQKGMGK